MVQKGEKKFNKKWKNILINLLKLTNFQLGCTYIKGVTVTFYNLFSFAKATVC